MNQGRIWCVVKPTVGLPLLLGSVAVTSLIVHYSVLSHTTWMSSYWQGGQKAKVSLREDGTNQVAALTPKADPAFTITVAPVSGTSAKNEASFVVTVAPNATAQQATDDTVSQPPAKLALAPPVEK